MKKVQVDVFQFRGNHYDFGMYQGNILRESTTLLQRWQQMLRKNARRFNVDVEDFMMIMTQFSPHILEELYGLQDALELDLHTTIQQFGGYYLDYGRSGCSIYTDHGTMVRNYDNDPNVYEGHMMLYAPTDGGYATIGPTMQITGRTDGINEKGLAMGYNFINRTQSKDGFMCNMIGRLVLENCANIDEAIQLLKELPHRYAFTYVLADPEQDGVIVEAAPSKVVVRHDYVCTNHFVTLTDQNRYRMDDSIRRSTAVQQAHPSIHNGREMYALMNGRDRGVFSTNYGAWSGTIHTSIMHPKTLQMGFTLGSDRLPYIVDFEKWVDGEDLRVKQINGQLETTGIFMNEK